MKISKILFYIFVLSFSINCTEEINTEQPNCGCDSETVKTIDENSGMTGSIYYKVQLDPKDNYYNNKFWIKTIEQGCVNCVHYMIVCNENLLSQEIVDLKSNGGSINIKFSGQLKQTCDKIVSPADVTYENINLTKIQIQ